MLCPEIIKKYVKDKNLQQNDYIFKISPGVTNRYLKRLAVKVLGNKKTLAGGKISELTMYDFRHSSACFWLPRYKSESHLKYRFGWKKSEMVHYYTELLDMRDNITQNDLLIDETRSLIEKKLEKSERENQLLKERMEALEKQVEKVMSLVEKVENLAKS